MKKYILIILAFAFSASIYAQDEQTHEFSISASGGLSALKYSVAGGTAKNGMGGGVGLGYTYNFTENWSIVTGLEFNLYKSKYTTDVLNVQYQIPTPAITPTPPLGANTDFFFNASFSNYEEKQSLGMLTIPIMAQYGCEMGYSGHKLYAALGMKIGIPLAAKYKTTANILSTWGYSEYTGQDYNQDHGFGTTNNFSTDGKFELKPSYMLAVELGMRWNTGEMSRFYTGIYFDYGLNNMQKSNDKNIIEYNPSNPDDYSYNSILQSNITDKIQSLSFGVKFRFALL